MPQNIKEIVRVLKEGGIIIYPTEGVYGLGCDPFNLTAVTRLLKIKERAVDQGLILITASWDQARDLIKTDLNKIDFPKSHIPTTWVFPATKLVPTWIKGRFNSVAIRVTTHLLARKICDRFGGAIVSTSANLSKQKPLSDLEQLERAFATKVDYIVRGKVGVLGRPTKICEIKTNLVIRS